jgi:hypothetical protein
VGPAAAERHLRLSATVLRNFDLADLGPRFICERSAESALAGRPLSPIVQFGSYGEAFMWAIFDLLGTLPVHKLLQRNVTPLDHPQYKFSDHIKKRHYFYNFAQ